MTEEVTTLSMYVGITLGLLVYLAFEVWRLAQRVRDLESLSRPIKRGRAETDQG